MPPPAGGPSLVRALGVRALAATTFNVIIGGGIFLLPATIAGTLGAAAPLAYLVCIVAIALIVLCFAEAGSRVSMTGGPYAYVEVALGPFVGFLGGVLLWLLMSFATAAVANGFAASLAALWAPLGSPPARALIIAALFAVLAATNIRGVGSGVRLIEMVTVAKLVPLLVFVAVGVFFVRPAHLAWPGMPNGKTLGQAVIVLIFAFAGMESALVPSGEVRDPSRTVPRALAIAAVGVTALYVALQLVAQGILGPRLASPESAAAPLASALGSAVGRWGALLMIAGAAISTFGHVSGMTLATPRALYAFGRDGFLPRALAHIHPRYRTPYIAIVTQSVIAALMAVTGTFINLVILADAAVLVLYFLCCVAAWKLRHDDVRIDGAAGFNAPGGGIVPWLACAVIVWILWSTPPRHLAAVAAVMLAAAVLFGLTAPTRRAKAADLTTANHD
ncbi:MAG: APC family permease [Gemmatimonadaceae bacterium]